MFRLKFIFLFIVIGVTGVDLFAGAWPRAKDSIYGKVSFRLIRADQFYEPGGNKIDIPTFSEYTTSLYLEYGLTDRLTIVGAVPFFKRITLNRQVGTSGFVFFDGDETNGFADFEIGARLGLWQNAQSVFSAEILFGIPVGDDTQENGLLTGDGELNQIVKIQYGYSAYPRPFYLTTELGFNNRTEGYSDEFLYSAEIGYQPGTTWLIALKFRGVESLKNGEDGVLGGMGGLYANNQRYLTYGTEISYSLNRHVALSLGVEGATQAENVLSAPAFSFGFSLQR